MPAAAARLIPPITATGTAKINGHGVATTNTARIVAGVPVISQPIAHMIKVSGVNHTA